MKTIRILAAVLLLTLLAAQSAQAATNYVLNLRTSADYITIPDSNSLDLIDNLTFEAWVNVAVMSNDGTIIGKRRTTAGTAYAFRVSAGKVALGMNNDFGDGKGVNFAVTSAADILTNRWTHVAATYDGTTAKVYINGVLKASSPIKMQLRASTFPLTIGREDLPGDARPFIGQIDEVRVWDTALSAQQIEANMGRVLFGREPHLVGYWDFDTGTGDLSPSGNLGELVGQARIVAGFQEFVKSQPVLSASGFSRLLGFRFRLQGEANATYQIDSSTDLQQWTPFVRLTQPSEPIVFTDTTATNFVNFRFYRVTRVP